MFHAAAECNFSSAEQRNWTKMTDADTDKIIEIICCIFLPVRPFRASIFRLFPTRWPYFSRWLFTGTQRNAACRFWSTSCCASSSGFLPLSTLSGFASCSNQTVECEFASEVSLCDASIISCNTMSWSFLFQCLISVWKVCFVILVHCVLQQRAQSFSTIHSSDKPL